MTIKDTRIKYVSFVNEKTKESFNKLEKGKVEDKQLYDFINRVIDDLKENPLVGIKIPRKQWPKEYIRKYGINNLWKYDLPHGWRLIYTIKGDAAQVVSIILEWFDHKTYNIRFGYKK